MNYRKTKFYKSLDSFRAVAYAEGFGEGEGASVVEQLTAWQYLHDTRLAYCLQSWFGRTATALLKTESIAQ
jgi:hypothetical protein